MGVLRRLTGRTLAERHLERGLVHLDKQEYSEAIADLVEAIALEPYNAELYSTRGFIYLESNNEAYLEYAREDLEYALYLDASQWVAEFCLGMIAYGQDELEEALRRFTLARERGGKKKPEIYYYLALIHYKSDDLVRASKEMDTALRLFREQKDSRKKFAQEWLAEFDKSQKNLVPSKPVPTRRVIPPRTTRRPSVVESGSLGYDRQRSRNLDDTT